MLWHEQAWPAIDNVDRDTPVMVPLGACEQHGHHLPVIVDTLQVTTIAEQVEARLGPKVLLTPTLWIGSSHHHKDYPGTLSLCPSLYSEVIKSTCESILRAGFTRIFFLNGHGGNETPAAQALSELVAENECADDAYLAIASWWSVAEKTIGKVRPTMSTPFISHACEYETSFMLAIRPDLVDMERVGEGPAVLDSPWFNSEYGGRVGVFRRYHRMTASGSMGRPSEATSDKGKALLDGVVDEVAKFLVDLSKWPKLPKIGPR